MPIGTHQISDLLVNQTGLQTVTQIGLDNAADMVRADLEAHREVLLEALADIALPTTERLEAEGTFGAMTMYDADEYSRVPTQKVTGSQNLGYPLNKRSISIGWTAEWFRQQTGRDLALAVLAAEAAHVAKVYRDLRRAIYKTANYDFPDLYLNPGQSTITIPVKRLVNADGQQIMVGPNGEAFDGATHTHYLANATLTSAFATSLVNTVLEHRVTAGVRIAIDATDETEWRALTGFKEYPDPRLVPVDGSNRQTVDLTRMNNRAIGTYGAAEVWVKPWALADYPLAYDAMNPPVRYRQRVNESLQGLTVAAQNDAFPMHAQFMEAHYGFGIKARTAAAVLYNAGGAYTDPTIN